MRAIRTMVPPGAFLRDSAVQSRIGMATSRIDLEEDVRHPLAAALDTMPRPSTLPPSSPMILSTPPLGVGYEESPDPSVHIAIARIRGPAP